MTLTRRGFLARCGQCAAGALFGGALAGCGGERPPEPAAGAGVGDPLGLGIERWSRSVCDLCGLGEPVFVGIRDGRPAAVKGIARSTIGFGRLCPRARALATAAVAADRAVQPLLRRDPATKGTLEGLEPVTWDEALRAAADGLAAARERLGGAGIAIFASDGETAETYGLLGRIARAGLGTDHLDTPARLDALHAYEACGAAFGTPANPGSVADVDAADLIVMIGGDLAESHPALFHRVLDARRSGRARVALVDARRTEAAAVADLHLRVAPGREVDWVNLLAAGVLADRARGGEDRACDPEPWRAWLSGRRAADAPGVRAPLEAAGGTPRGFDPAAAIAAAGLDPAAAGASREAWRRADHVVSLVGPTALGGPAGGMLARAVAQLHRATGQWGRAGRGPLFLPRGANATAVVAFGIAPGRLPAGRRLADPAGRDEAAAAWGVPADRLPARPGLPSLEWPAAVMAGRIGAILVHRANVAAEMPAAPAWRAALERAFVVATATHAPSETAVFSDVVLPVALVCGESAGTMMTLDRRCALLEAGARPPGEARPAGRLLADLARLLLDPETGARLLGAADEAPFAEWERWQALAAGTVFEARGISPRRLGEELAVAWPCGAEGEPGADRVIPRDGTRAILAPTPAPAWRPAASGGLVLVSGPIREHAGSRVRTGRTPELHYEAPAAQLEMHPEDGRRLGLPDGEWVTIESSSGSASARLWLTDRVPPGVVYLPEHYGFLSDLQGGSATQKEPEGLAHRLTSCDLVAGSDAPAGLLPAVSVRRAQRRDMRQRGV